MNRVTIHDFQPGAVYSVGVVALFFGKSAETIRTWIAAGKLKAVRTNPLQTHGPEQRTFYLIDGNEVRRFFGAGELAADARKPQPVLESAKKRAAKRLKQLANL